MGNEIFKDLKIQESEIVINSIPSTLLDKGYSISDDFHSFEISKGEIENGYFILTISSKIICPVVLDAYRKIIDESKSRLVKSVEITPIEFNTRDKFKISETEKFNLELAYELTVNSINNFNLLFKLQSSTFSDGRNFNIPTYEDWLNKKKQQYITT